jgi:hypothetical protein
MTRNAKFDGADTGSKNDASPAIEEFREKMAKTRGELEESLRRSRKALAEADAALKIGAR